ncbi:MAG: ankyrin repeat domain-containing protein [Rhodoferax sp.]|nr:ankyrin repeat domain-containing protein [Rhodoferax sp.]
MNQTSNRLKSRARKFINYFKKSIYVLVFSGYSLSFAGSYEDYFAAIKVDDAAALKTLLQRGFDPNTRDPAGQHGLLIAVRENAIKVADVLVDWPKTEVETRTVADENPLMFAALNGQTALAKKLIAKGADVNKPGWAPLHYAATRGHLQVMTLLLDNHAYIDASSPNGTTPLMMAAFYGTPSAVKLLLEAGADPLIKNDQSLSAIDFAHRNNRQDSADIISAFVRARQPKGKW